MLEKHMSSQPWLSVIIPTYNGEQYLPFALDSIVNQENQGIECIVIDDGSTDNTPSILQRYQKKISLRFLQGERKGNWVTNTNRALSEASGQYIGFLHQDDLWFPNRLNIMRGLVTEYPEVSFFLHPAYYLDDAGNKLGMWKCPLPPVPRVIEPQLMMEKLLVQNFIAIPSPIFRSEVARQVGGLETTFWYTADWDFWLKVAACGNSLYYPQPLSGFRIHSSSQTITRSSQLDDFRSQLETVAQRYLVLWDAPEQRKRAVRKIANFSIEVNVALAGKVHGHKINTLRLLIVFLGLGPSGWYRYIRDSRILERVSARLKARIKPLKASPDTGL